MSNANIKLSVCGLFFLAIHLSSFPLLARVKYPVAAEYEDTVRIVVIYNAGAFGPATGCGSNLTVGRDTRDFVIAALDTMYVRNVKVAAAVPSTVASVSSAFGNKLPHVVVHCNAGWTGASGNNMPSIMEWALSNNVGFVEVGDDDMLMLVNSFSWIYLIDMWGPMGTGLWLNKPGDRLYMVMAPELDTWCDSAVYPYLNGVIRNAYRIAASDTIEFKPTGTGPNARCEADPDVIGIKAGRQNNVLFLAYQQGYNATQDSLEGPAGYVGNAWDYCTVTLLKDSVELVGGGWLERRAASLSIQPQFLKNTEAAKQFVYDAIMYASLVHKVNPLPPYTKARFNPFVRRAGETANATAGMSVRVADISGRLVYDGTTDMNGRLAMRIKDWRHGAYIITTMNRKSQNCVRTFVILQ